MRGAVAGDENLAKLNGIIDETLKEICLAKSITDEATISYVKRKLIQFWESGLRSREKLLARVSLR